MWGLDPLFIMDLMGIPEQAPRRGIEHRPFIEELNPYHFYAAYIFDQAQDRQVDIAGVIQHAWELGYPVCYWWLSQALELRDDPDRLIVCVHHANTGPEAGMD